VAAVAQDDKHRSADVSRWLPLRRQCNHERRSDQMPAFGAKRSPRRHDPFRRKQRRPTSWRRPTPVSHMHDSVGDAGVDMRGIDASADYRFRRRTPRRRASAMATKRSPGSSPIGAAAHDRIRPAPIVTPAAAGRLLCHDCATPRTRPGALGRWQPLPRGLL